jgi:hypothetical protein
MKEYMLIIRNTLDSKSSFSIAQDLEFLNSCNQYIGKLEKGKNLIAAQPLIREGKILSGTPGAWKEDSFHTGKEVIVGYYHLLAKDLQSAIELAKENPEFTYTSTASIEVRPVKMKEETTGFVYPDKKNLA